MRWMSTAGLNQSRQHSSAKEPKNSRRGCNGTRFLLNRGVVLAQKLWRPLGGRRCKRRRLAALDCMIGGFGPAVHRPPYLAPLRVVARNGVRLHDARPCVKAGGGMAFQASN